jgi:DNA-binding NarL/FixJ family response regulator
MKPRPSQPIAIPVPAALRSAEFVRDGVEYLVLSYGVVAPPLPAVLTPAEQAVVRAILDGESNTAIARARGTSTRTVANQIAAIFDKVGASSRAELIAVLRQRNS